MVRFNRFQLRLVTTIAAMSGLAAGVRAEPPRKYAGRLFDDAPPPAFLTGPRPASTAVDPKVPQSSPKALPPLHARVVVVKGQELPPDLKAALLPRAAGLGGKQNFIRPLALGTTSPKTIGAALRSDVVSFIEIDRPPRINPFLPVPANREARRSHLVDTFLATFSMETQKGAGVVCAVFDGGKIRHTHTEFKGGDDQTRVTIHSSATMKVDEHATHVAGTIGARGKEDAARGMAEQVRVLSFDWLNDTSNLAAGGGSFQVSNHSYGPAAGWDFDPDRRVWFWWGDTTVSPDEDAKFGKYGGDNNALDAALVDHPHLLTFVAAGNERTDAPPSQPIRHYLIGRNPATGELEWQVSDAVRRADGFDQGGLDTIAGLAVSKNCVTVGAVNDIASRAEPIQTTTFSSWGPTDDGRIKPDVVANGHGLLSTSSADDEAYVQLSGTSMASPTAAGIGALLIEFYTKVKGRQPMAAEIKAVLIHTAVDAGQIGPDPVYGWGSIETLRAARVIKGAGGEVVRSDEVAKGATKEFEMEPTGHDEPIRVTLVWADPAGPPNAGGLDDAAPVLVNDLDLTLVAQDGTTYYPYSLNRARPLDRATTNGPNRVDNVEVVDAPRVAGKWKIRVRGEGIREGDRQKFALVVTGLKGS